MAARKTLHRLVDTLPERDLSTAARVLEALTLTVDPVERSLALAGREDEPENDDFDDGLAEARREAREGQLVSHDAVKREFGIS